MIPPYDEIENPEVEVTVCVSKTYHKTYTVKVKDYQIIDEYEDEDGEYQCEIDFSDCNLQEALERQYGIVHPDKTWTEDEQEVILDRSWEV